MNESRTALIVGAGIGGLAAAVALKRVGWNVRVYERASQVRELGFGLVLAANAVSALRELGVADAIVPAAVETNHVEIRRLDGTVLRRFNAQLGGPTFVALRPVLHGGLLRAVGETALRLHRQVVSYRAQGDRVTLTTSDGTTDAGSVLIGADGAGSIIRRQLHPQEPPARPSGFCALRGVADGACRYLGDLGGVVYLDDGIEAATVRASRDAVYWYVSLLALELPPNYHTPRAILNTILPRFEQPLRSIVSATRNEDLRFDVLLQRDPLKNWGSGPVTLLGDAAHPLLPHTGQGAAQALEDAVALGLAMSGPGSIDARLRRYEIVRARRTETFITLGPRIARITTTRSALKQAVRSFALRVLPEKAIRQMAASLGRDPHRALRVGREASAITKA